MDIALSLEHSLIMCDVIVKSLRKIQGTGANTGLPAQVRSKLHETSGLDDFCPVTDSEADLDDSFACWAQL